MTDPNLSRFLWSVPDLMRRDFEKPLALAEIDKGLKVVKGRIQPMIGGLAT